MYTLLYDLHHVALWAALGFSVATIRTEHPPYKREARRITYGFIALAVFLGVAAHLSR